MKKLKALIIGATGATGRELVSELLKDNCFYEIVIFARKKPEITHRKLKSHIIDFNKIEEYKELIFGDVLFSALGTTKKTAGSKEKQFLIDFSYQYEFAKIAAQNGIIQYQLVSSMGANINSLFFYPKIKGKLEEAVKGLKFKYIQIFRPPILIRPDDLIRNNEKIAIRLITFLNNIGIMKSQRPLSVKVLALRMKQEALNPKIKKIKIHEMWS